MSVLRFSPIRLETYVARRYLASSSGGMLFSLITWIALGGVTVGVAALIVVIGVMSGMQRDLLDKILDSSPHVLVLQDGSALRMDNWERVTGDIKTVDGVVGVSTFCIEPGECVKGRIFTTSRYVRSCTFDGG